MYIVNENVSVLQTSLVITWNKWQKEDIQTLSLQPMVFMSLVMESPLLVWRRGDFIKHLLLTNAGDHQTSGKKYIILSVSVLTLSKHPSIHHRDNNRDPSSVDHEYHEVSSGTHSRLFRILRSQSSVASHPYHQVNHFCQFVNKTLLMSVYPLPSLYTIQRKTQQWLSICLSKVLLHYNTAWARVHRNMC